jgi:type I restriction enzyme M protein
MPNAAAVSADAQEQFIRRRMVEDGVVECVIALPRQLFAGTAAPAMIWILRRPDDRAEHGDRAVLIVDARQFGTKAGRQRVLTDDESKALTDCAQRWQRGERSYHQVMEGRGAAMAVPVADMAEHGHSLDPSDYLTAQPSSSVRGAGVALPRPAAMVEAQTKAARAADEQTARITAEPRVPGGRKPNWEQVRLAELCEIQAGPSHSRFKNVEYAAEGILLVTPAHLRDRRISAEGTSSISRESARGLKKYLLRTGDVLLVRTGTVGPTALVTAAEDGSLPATNLLRLRPADGVDSRWLLAVLSAPTAQIWIAARSESASAIPSISAGTLRAMPVLLPPLEEQHRIGQAIDAFDTQIMTHHALAKAADDARTALADDLVNGLLEITSPLEGES